MDAKRSKPGGAVNVTVRLEPELVERLDAVSRKTFRKRSDVVRMAIARFFEAEQVAREGGEL